MLLSIKISDADRVFVVEQASLGSYATTAEYIRQLVRCDFERVKSERLVILNSVPSQQRRN
ncbi:hypothetical protein ACCC88_03590 [Sphingomonas sp. Sphisp140]|uniref:hypothetical protein n=1 Tax=unclassified Sphingomonas TaxID=196159 RepID=UPI0039B022A4